MTDQLSFDPAEPPTEPTWDPEEPPADPVAALRGDPYLGSVVAANGPVEIAPAPSLFERFVVSVLRQQVSMASAEATRERLFEAVDVTPAGILDADDATLREAGLSRQKTRYVDNIAAAFESEGYDRASFADMSDEAVRAELTSITGVGEWTANMQLLFSLGREDVFPVGDLGVRKGVRAVVGDDDEALTRGEMREFARRWRPFRSYATLYLWKAEDAAGGDVKEVVEG
ncbi:MAG: DNA-3-methyladenine glycosylase [Halolamina sp.]